MMPASGSILGYDPGGDGKHGVACLTYSRKRVLELHATTVANADAAVQYASNARDVFAAGVDTLTAWSGEACGWRPADRLLREKYVKYKSSVVSPNGLYGSMCLNGMYFLARCKESRPSMHINETHPKILHAHFRKKKYESKEKCDLGMLKLLSDLSGVGKTDLSIEDEHAWDAAISAIATFKGLRGEWPVDLHAGHGQLIHPAGISTFFWPPFPKP